MQIKLTLSFAIAALLTFAMASSAQAALTVANTNDSGPGSLRQTVAEAGPGETINLPAGTYTLTSEELKVEKSVTLAGHATADTIVRSGGPFRVIVAIGDGKDVTLSNLTVRDGFESSPAVGAGILSAGPNLTLQGVSVTANVAAANGTPGNPGGVAQGAGIVVSEGSFKMIDSSVTNNLATAVGGNGASGGVAFTGGLVVSSDTFTISGSTISNNTADARGGQGPSNASQAGGVVQGGGMIATPLSAAASTVTGTTISGNLATASGGPGASGGVVFTAGVLTSASEGPLTYANTTIAGNEIRNERGLVSEAAGLFAGSSDTGAIKVMDTTIADNAIRAENGNIALAAGAVATAEDGASFEFLGSTIADNRIVGPIVSVAEAGNLLSEGIRLGDTIVSGGSGAKAGTENCVGFEPVSLGFNIDSTDQCGFHYIGDKVNTDPLLGPLAFNGGPTQTMAPALASPAIDQGKSFGLTSDQRGVIRPIDLPTIPNSAAAGADGSDIGAVEYQPSNALVLGKLTKNKKKGTATLAVSLPAPSVGTLTLSGKGLKTQALAIAGETEVKLKVAAASKAVKKALRKKGKRKVQIDVTYAPTGNAPATQIRKAKLVKKKKKHRKHSKK